MAEAGPSEKGNEAEVLTRGHKAEVAPSFSDAHGTRRAQVY